MTSTHILHTARLNNNCPICFAKDGLELEFSQEQSNHKFYEKSGKEITSKMYCHTCRQDIFPVNWTDDIERVYEYNRKLAIPNSSSIKIKPIVYIVILLAIITVAAFVLGIIR